MFKKILLATSPQVIEKNTTKTAIALARTLGAELIIFHSLLLPEKTWAAMTEFVQQERFVAEAAKEIENSFAEELKTVPAYSIHVSIKSNFGEELLSLVCKQDFDLIIMDSHIGNIENGRSVWAGLGTYVENVCANAICPIMILRSESPAFTEKIKRIVMATDFSTPAAKALSYAAELARSHNAKLYVFHALDIGPGFPDPKYSHQDMQCLVDNVCEDMKQKYANILKDIDHEFISWEGIPYVEIMKCARWNKADVIVMTDHSSPTRSCKRRSDPP